MLVAALPGRTQAAESDGTGRQYIEVRCYRFASAEKRDAYAKFLGEAGVAALNRAGVAAVGIFRLMEADNPKLKLSGDPLEIWVVLPHDSVESVVGLEGKLGADKEYQEAGKEILLAGKADPAFVRFDSHLLWAFEGHPRMTPPSEKAEGRMYELRTYESPSEERAINKLAMFNGGEIPMFGKAGMPPVFFGEAVAGNDLPHLTYMIYHGAEDPKGHWMAFQGGEEWKKMSTDPVYKDNVSKITNRFLRPVAGSQL
jgi:hypothetical protein